MVLKNWKKTIKHGIIIFDNKKRDTKVIVSIYDYGNRPRNYQLIVSSVKEGLKGYPHNRFNITKAQAIRYAKNYMKRHG